MDSPYENLEERAFWRTGVAAQHPLTIRNLYRKKFDIAPDMPVVTAGSCFAQHIARFMRARGFTVIDKEPPPGAMTPDTAARFGYGLFSARYGNIYTTRQLLQIAREAFGELAIDDPEALIWQREGRYFDAMRPGVEPEGLESAEELFAHRAQHLDAVREAFREARLFVFTFGLTEYWEDTRFGLAYPTAPGTIAGRYNADHHHFRNAEAGEVLDEFLAFKQLIEAHNPDIKFLLTVSPVPLTATASDAHVLAATTYSKSVLRAVAGTLEQRFDNVDYFPSYEMVASPFARGMFYEPNLRAVNPGGVAAVMRLFFAEHPGSGPAEGEDATGRTDALDPADDEDDAVCEEILLDAFAPR
ncbi:GSCFA domain-containing protein [Parasphingopyxis marina]|uniref:GSCFA domain-containing protein n=1 Tax=Parasphingopyxis marina TaxID=2761622 RepID=A0A842HTQ4_9SPHN|nr:GSCFA domain-containing protein [Parasphingopyxis marina]MBC2776315.1 GSCFA domain-containing protein [Parasphingopyxis marina]